MAVKIDVKYKPKVYSMKLKLGDWFPDEVSRGDAYFYSTNYPVDDIRKAYLDSVEKYKLSFHNTKLAVGSRRNDPICNIGTGFGDYCMPECAINKIINIGELPEDLLDFITCDRAHTSFNKKIYSEFWWWFVGLSLDNLDYNLIKDPVPNINGPSGDQNINSSSGDSLILRFGYGLYY